MLRKPTTPDSGVGEAVAPRSVTRDSKMGWLILGAVAVAAALAFMTLLVRHTGEPLILSLLAVLSIIGVFSLFSMAVGLLQFSESRLAGDLVQAYADQSSDGMQIIDDDGSVIYTNGAFKTLLSDMSLGGELTVSQALAGEPSAVEALGRLSNAAKMGQSWDETVVLGASSSAPIVGQNGQLSRSVTLQIGVRHILQRGFGHPGDRMTVWRVSELFTADSQDQTQVDAAVPQHAGVMNIANDGSVDSIGGALTKWLGYDVTSSPIEGMSLQQLAAPEFAAQFANRKSSGNGTETFSVSGGLIAVDGTLVPVEASFKRTKDETGADIWLGVVLRSSKSVTSGDTAGNQMAEARYSRLFHSAPIAIATLDKKGRITNANDDFAQLFAQSGRGNATAGVTFRTRIEKSARDAVDRACKAAMEGQAEIAPVEVQVNGRDEKMVRLFPAPVAGVEGGKDAVMLFAVDMTQQRELEEQFAQSQKMQAVGQLAGGMAHDFNNVLTTIILSSDFLLGNHRPTDPAFKDILAIKQNANRAAGIVRQLLAFSRQQTLRPETLSVPEIISDLYMWLSRSLGETVKCKVSHGRDLWAVKADKTQFEQVIMNLAVNARDAMPDGGTLQIRTRNVTERESQSLKAKSDFLPVGEYVLCEVSDTGCGMPEDVVEKVFLPFFSTKEVGQGTGLGLSTVYGIVKQTGGFIFVDSTPGEGTTFRIYLPRYVETAEELEQASAAAEAQAQERPRDLTGSGTILLVEDEDAVRNFAVRALTSRGYEVKEASSGVEAVEVLDAHGSDFDLVVSDVVMPEMDGPTLLKELRKRNKDAKVIFISGYAEDAFKKNLDQDETFVFLPKPFSLKQLAAAVKQTLE